MTVIPIVVVLVFSFSVPAGNVYGKMIATSIKGALG